MRPGGKEARIVRRKKQERELAQFILEMQRTIAVDEIFIQLRKKVKTQKKIFEIYFYQKDESKSILLYFNQGRVKIQKIESLGDSMAEPAWLKNSQQMQLAQVFARPLNRVIRFPLAENVNTVEVWLEVIGTDSNIQEYVYPLMEIFKITKMVMDRVLSDEILSIESQRWINIFDALKEPVAVISNDFKIIRSNSKFQKRKSSAKCYEKFAGRQSPCEGCPLVVQMDSGSHKKQSSQIQVDEQFYSVHSHAISESRFVHYYENVTAERTLYARLIQTEKLGALGALAGQVAHELNNPLSGIKNLSQVIKSDLNSEEQIYQDLSEVEKAASRCQNIIRQLLEFTKEEGLETSACRFDEIIQKTLPLLKTAMRLHRIHIDLQAGEALVMVEPQLIQQVVFNLVNNACQAMIQPGTLSIRSRCVDSIIEFDVEDTGPGIPENIQARLFEAFFTTKKVGTGTGLGLYLSQKILERFKGTLDFQTSPQGTQFVGRLPKWRTE